MNIYEKIKSMSIDEMADFLNGIPNECYFCECGLEDCGSVAGTKAYLEKKWVKDDVAIANNKA